MDATTLAWLAAFGVVVTWAGQLVILRAMARAWRTATPGERLARRADAYCEAARRTPCPQCAARPGSATAAGGAGTT